MPVLALHCSLCNVSFKSKPAWNGHLLQNRHQQFARRGLLKWKEPDRACALIVYGTVAVGKDLQVIEHLSKDLGTFVTDFVWLEERSRVGFVQFESEEKVREVVASLVDKQFRVGDKQYCHVKEVGSLPEFEWNGFLPDQDSPTTTDREEEEGEELDLNVPRRPTCPPPSANTPSGGDNESEPEAMDIGQGEESTESENGPTPASAGPGPGRPDPSKTKAPKLWHHLQSIRKLVEIPDREFHTAMDILRRAKEVLRKLQKDGDPAHLSVLISRHFSLQLRYWPNVDQRKRGNMYLYLLLYKYMDTEEDPHLSSMSRTDLDGILGEFLVRIRGVRQFLTYKLKKRHRDRAGSQTHGITKYEIKLPHSGRPFFVGIVADPEYAVEAQTWQLTRYLSMFDQRCPPVLAVIYYWANLNSVKLGSSKWTDKELPKPCSLNWLLILFLQLEGILPCTKLLLDQPHKTMIFKDKEGRGTDIGFSDCPQFRSRWRKDKRTDSGDEGFAEEVFTLVYRFFLFCSGKFGGAETESKGGTWILNTRDAEIINMRRGRTSPKSKLSEAELTTISNSLAKDDPEKLIVLSPFSINWRMSTRNAEQAFRVMGMTGRKLKDYLDKDKGAANMNGCNVGNKTSLDNFLQLFKV